MKLIKRFKQLFQKRNRIVSIILKRYQNWRFRFHVSALRVKAGILNLFGSNTELSISKRDFFNVEENDQKELILKCAGALEINNEDVSQTDMSTFYNHISNADLALAMAMNDDSTAAVNKLQQLMNMQKLHTFCAADQIASKVFCTGIGNFSVTVCKKENYVKNEKHFKLQMMRHFLVLKRNKIDYHIIYIENHIDDSNGAFFELLSQIGFDYIIGVNPKHCGAGSTYLKADGRVARTIDSLGCIVSSDYTASKKRIVLHLKLKAIQGKLQLVEETYVPYYQIDNTGLVSLLEDNTPVLTAEETRKYKAEIEDQLDRIRPADRMLTIAQVMKLINVTLPENLEYMKDFSVGKICARSMDVAPGDIFFFREGFADPNDLEVVDPRHRVRIAKKAVRKGAELVVTFQKLPFKCNAVLCDNVMEAHITVCAYLSRQFDMKTIGITGSIGKTSTKDMLAEVLKMRYNTVKSERNSNVQVKISMNLQKLNSACEMFVQEIGGGRPGGASRHSRMICPEVTVVTNIGDAHIGNFGSKEKLMENKLQIIEGMQKGGVLYLNADDPLLWNAKPDCRTVFYAVRNQEADYYATNIQTHGGYCTFDVVGDGKCTAVRLNVLGEYNVLNAVGCFAIGKQFNISEDLIVRGLANFHTTGIRQNLIEVCGRKFFMDCYNASSESVKSALEILTQIQLEPGKKRIAVIGDITGVGDMTEMIHREIGHTILKYPVDYVFLFGTEVRYTYDAIREKCSNVYYFSKRDEINRKLKEIVDEGDAAMFKGSSKMLLEKCVDMVYGTRMTDERLEDEGEYKVVKNGALTYNLFSDYATVEAYSSAHENEKRIQVAEHIGSIEVVNMGRALKGKSVHQVLLPNSIRHISAEAFKDCVQLREIRLSERLKYIGNGAFQNCAMLKEVSLPGDLLHIGKDAFAGCRSLKKITIPASVVQIGENAFADCKECEFFCVAGSYAEAYLVENGLYTK